MQPTSNDINRQGHPQPREAALQRLTETRVAANPTKTASDVDAEQSTSPSRFKKDSRLHPGLGSPPAHPRAVFEDSSVAGGERILRNVCALLAFRDVAREVPAALIPSLLVVDFPVSEATPTKPTGTPALGS